jgi:hypothetical protein
MYSPKSLKFSLERLSEELHNHTKGKTTYHLYITGGSALALGYGLKDATEDIDACIKRGTVVQKCIERVAKAEGISPKWCGQGVRYTKSYTTAVFIYNKLWAELPSLNVYVVDIELLLLCMKLIAFREKDSADIGEIVHKLKSEGVRLDGNKVNSWFDKYYRDFPFGVPLSGKAKLFIDNL